MKKWRKQLKEFHIQYQQNMLERIYKNGKTVFVGKSHLGKVSKGDKFIIYESHGAKAYTGWADIN